MGDQSPPCSEISKTFLVMSCSPSIAVSTFCTGSLQCVELRFSDSVSTPAQRSLARHATSIPPDIYPPDINPPDIYPSDIYPLDIYPLDQISIHQISIHPTRMPLNTLHRSFRFLSVVACNRLSLSQPNNFFVSILLLPNLDQTPAATVCGFSHCWRNSSPHSKAFPAHNRNLFTRNIETTDRGKKTIEKI